MDVHFERAMIVNVETVALEGKKPFQVLGIMQVLNGRREELDLTCGMDTDLKSLPTLEPLEITMVVYPSKAGYKQYLRLGAISVQKLGKKGGD